VKGETRELWQRLCEQAAVEQDPEKLFSSHGKLTGYSMKKKNGWRTCNWNRTNRTNDLLVSLSLFVEIVSAEKSLLLAQPSNSRTLKRAIKGLRFLNGVLFCGVIRSHSAIPAVPSFNSGLHRISVWAFAIVGEDDLRTRVPFKIDSAQPHFPLGSTALGSLLVGGHAPRDRLWLSASRLFQWDACLILQSSRRWRSWHSE